MTAQQVRVGRREVPLSSPDKVLFADPGVTKAELADYYRTVADVMLPHVRSRPLALQRFPDGSDAEGFIQKKVPTGAPDWVRSATVDRERGGTVTMLCADDTPTLVYLADQAVLTLHPWLATADAPRRPVRLVFDLDPPSGSDFGAVVFAATALRELLDELGLPGYPMTTGSRGMHVAVPLAGREDVDDVRDGARRIADTLAARHPDRLTTKVRKASRQGRLFVDTLRHAYAQHAVAPYSPRPLPGAPVAMPVSWDEVAGGEVAARGFRLRDVATRLSTVDDPWAGMARRARTLAPALRRLPD